MSYNVFRPDLLTAIVHPVGCQAITTLFPREALVVKLDSRGIQGELRRRILETWDALHTTGRVPEALGAAVPAPVEALPTDETTEVPIDANEAGRRLGVTGARFRQIRKDEGIEPVGRRSGADLYDPAEVAELAASRALDKSRVAGPNESESDTKAA
ncbi:hypothetical protein [Citricoccus sp. GCM10030269]|uniref:hypothetical protein n=1 Tax=Citricoccus sp. GCM10030269 TaxID=3273388 RepID=UPI0036135075